MKKQAGATSFEEFGYGTNPGRVWKELQEEANYQYGNDMYAGHIGIKDGWRWATREVMTHSQASAYANENDRDYGKWDDAGCIAVGEEKVIVEKDFSVTVKAKNAQEAERLVREKMMGGKKRAGAIVEVQIPYRGVTQTAPAGKRKLTTDRSNGDVYFIIGSNTHNKYRTKKEAVAKLKEILETTARVNPGDVVRIVKVQDQGGLSYTESSKLATFTVTGKRIQKKIGKVKGFLFFGWAAS
jgi:hypothetical protein